MSEPLPLRRLWVIYRGIIATYFPSPRAIAIAFPGAVVLRHITDQWCVPHGLEDLQTGCLLPHAGAASRFEAVE